MDERVPSTMFSDATVIGRIFGQGSNDECLFDVIVDDQDRPAIRIRVRPELKVLDMPQGAAQIVQLFEHPEVLWLATPTIINGMATILYAPLEPLESADGRCEIPALAEVTLEQVDEAVHDAMDNRENTWGQS